MDIEGVRFVDSLEGVSPINLHGFFVGWPNPPSPETHLKLLEGSDHFWLAVEENSGDVAGFITAITDGVLSAYISLVEVLPEHQGRGIGRELTRRMIDQLKHLYIIDLVCDMKLQSFYASLGMTPGPGMMIRNYDHQAGVDRA